MAYKVGVIIEKDEHVYCAYCPVLEDCQTQGDFLEEVLSNIKEASLSKEILTTTLDVVIAWKKLQGDKNASGYF